MEKGLSQSVPRVSENCEELRRIALITDSMAIRNKRIENMAEETTVFKKYISDEDFLKTNNTGCLNDFQDASAFWEFAFKHCKANENVGIEITALYGNFWKLKEVPSKSRYANTAKQYVLSVMEKQGITADKVIIEKMGKRLAFFKWKMPTENKIARGKGK